MKSERIIQWKQFLHYSKSILTQIHKVLSPNITQWTVFSDIGNETGVKLTFSLMLNNQRQNIWMLVLLVSSENFFPQTEILTASKFSSNYRNVLYIKKYSTTSKASTQMTKQFLTVYYRDRSTDKYYSNIHLTFYSWISRSL